MSPDQVAEVGSGVVTGGWTYVTAAYAVCWTVLVGYVASLWWRHPRGEA